MGMHVYTDIDTQADGFRVSYESHRDAVVASLGLDLLDTSQCQAPPHPWNTGRRVIAFGHCIGSSGMYVLDSAQAQSGSSGSQGFTLVVVVDDYETSAEACVLEVLRRIDKDSCKGGVSVEPPSKFKLYPTTVDWGGEINHYFPASIHRTTFSDGECLRKLIIAASSAIAGLMSIIAQIPFASEVAFLLFGVALPLVIDVLISCGNIRLDVDVDKLIQRESDYVQQTRTQRLYEDYSEPVAHMTRTSGGGGKDD